MKLWIDDVRPAPDGYIWAKSVDEAINLICLGEHLEGEAKYTNSEIQGSFQITLIDIDHDAGDYAKYGGDYIKVLVWLEHTGRNYPIHIHSMNPVGVANMRRIIERNGWEEVK
jgi:hypothetical protein